MINNHFTALSQESMDQRFNLHPSLAADNSHPGLFTLGTTTTIVGSSTTGLYSFGSHTSLVADYAFPGTYLVGVN